MLLTLKCFGDFQVTWEGQPVSFATHTARALLAYLALNAEQAHPREKLSALFWPDQPQATAFTNLRSSLARVRRALPNEAEALLITQHSIRFRREAARVDANDFADLLAACARHSHASPIQCAECAQRMAQAAALYAGELLQHMALHASQPFEEWLLLRREQFRRQALSALETLCAHHEQRGDYEALRREAHRQLVLEPWHEPAHRALMRGLALAGDRTTALVQYEVCRRVLAQELGIEPDAETQALAERIRAGELAPTLTTPLAPLTPQPPPHNLPAHLTPFVGRESELAEITAQLRQPGVRLLSLVGGGGMGKTRLAVEAARAQLGEFAEGVFFVSLTALAETASIVPAIAAAFGLSLHGGDPRQVLLRALHDKHLLLVLDNFEHLLNGANLVIELLQAAPQVQCLITSRERLNVQGEHIYSVWGMEYATQHALTSSAVRLFVQSAQRVQPAFTLSETNLPVVLRLCQLVEGMPLGLELAAAWVEALSLDEIVAEIERSADFLAYAWRDAPERQRSLRAVFDWSWALLNETEQNVYRQVSVFRGGFTREAAQAVVGASLRVLTSLVHKSLLRVGQGRYDVHELLRQFAAQKLEAAPSEYQATEERHGQFYIAFVTARESRLKLDQQREAVAEIRAELDNFRRAWSWAVAQVRVQELNRAAHTIWMFYQAAAPLLEQEGIFRLVVEGLQAALAQGPDERHIQPMQRVLGRMLAYYARTLNAQGRHHRAIPFAQQAISISAASGGAEGEAMGYLVWGQALSRMAQPQEAHPRLHMALQLVQQAIQDHAPTESLRDTEWITYIWLATNSLALHKPHQARDYLQQGSHTFLTPNHPRGETTYLVNNADVDLYLGDYAAAQARFEQALQIARQGQPWAEGFALINLGKIKLQLGEYSAALALLQQGQGAMREMGDAWQQAQALGWLARLAIYLGRYAQAKEYLDQFSEITNPTESPEVVYLGEFARARLALATGEYERALAHARRAGLAAQQAHHQINNASALTLAGHSHLGLRQFSEAADAYEHALTLYMAVGNVRLAAEAQAGLAAVALAQNNPVAALAQVEGPLKIVADHPQQVGLDAPFTLYLICYRVLRANHDARAAHVLQTAHNILQAYADRIPDDALRSSFLDNVATHDELWQAYACGVLG